jgi:putative SOS response-associated peptidase YedK
MCGRFTMATNTEALEERFHAQLSTELAVPTYNAAPSQAQLTILNAYPQAIVRAAWGLVVYPNRAANPEQLQTRRNCLTTSGV